MKTRVQMFCLWCGPAGILFWLVGFYLIGNLIPPPQPSASALQIQAFYLDNRTGIRAGLVMTMVGASLTAPWVAAISSQLKRVEGETSPLAYLQLGCGMLGILLFIFPVMFMQAAAYRPERSADLILLVNDMAWIPFDGVWSLAFIQNLAIALCVFMDKKERVFPRWFGWYNLWTILLFIPGSLLYFFTTGPFAWNGALSWWLVVVDFVFWFVITFVVVRRAIHSEGRELAAGSSPQTPPAATNGYGQAADAHEGHGAGPATRIRTGG